MKWIYAIASIIPFVNLIPLLGVLITKLFAEDENDEFGFKYYKASLNRLYKCRNCLITSSYHQLNDSKCPHCNKYIWKGSDRLDDGVKHKNFPFAKKIRTYTVLKKHYIKTKEELIKRDLDIAVNYDKELEAYTNIQMKKLEEYERKAMEIKHEMELHSK